MKYASALNLYDLSRLCNFEIVALPVSTLSSMNGTTWPYVADMVMLENALVCDILKTRHWHDLKRVWTILSGNHSLYSVAIPLRPVTSQVYVKYPKPSKYKHHLHLNTKYGDRKK